MKRQRGRNRGGGNTGGKPQQQNANRAFDSNGPEGAKVRGNAQHVFEKYQQLARDAGTAGDRVLAEAYLQHAEHYFRVVRAMQPQRTASEILGRDSFSSVFEIDFEDESGAQAAAADAFTQDSDNAEGEGEARAWRDDRQDGGRQDNQGRRDERPRDQQRDDRPRDRDDRPRDRYRDDRPRDDRPREDRGDRQQRDDRPRDQQRDDRPRDDRPRDDRPQQRDDRPQQRDDRPRDDRPREDRGDRQQRDDRPRAEGNGGRRDRWRDRDDRPPREDRPERDPLAVVEPQATPLVAAAPERPAPVQPTPVLRDDDGGESHAPAFLKAPRTKAAAAAVAPAPDAADGDAPKPARRRRAPRSFEGGAASSSETEDV